MVNVKQWVIITAMAVISNTVFAGDHFPSEEEVGAIFPKAFMETELPQAPLIKCTIQNHPDADCLEYFFLPSKKEGRVDLYQKINPMWASQYKWTYMTYRGLELRKSYNTVQIEGRVITMAGRYYSNYKIFKNEDDRESVLNLFDLESRNIRTEQVSLKCEFLK